MNGNSKQAWKGEVLLRVKLDDKLLIERNVDLSALGQLVHEDAQVSRNNLQPCGNYRIN